MYDIAILTDATHTIGLGHVQRQIAVAKAAVRLGYRVLFVALSEMAADLCIAQGFRAENCSNAGEVSTLLKKEQVSGIIVDLYEKDFTAYRTVCDAVKNSLSVVSSVGWNAEYTGSNVILYGSAVNRWDDKREVTVYGKKIRIRSGRAWIIFRQEFTDRESYMPREQKRIMIAHGGTDPHGLTLRSIRALEKLPGSYAIDVLITSRFTDSGTIRQLCEKSRHKCDLIVDAANIVPMLSRATAVIINGGNLRYEACITGTPFVAISYQQQQYDYTEPLSQLGAGINLGVMHKVSDSMICRAVESLTAGGDASRKIQEISAGLFDLQGAERVVRLLFGKEQN